MVRGLLLCGRAPTTPMTLADRTHPSLIIPRLRGTDAATVLQELSQSMQRAGVLPDLLDFYHTALNRELMISSEVEAGMALPHARLPGLREVAFAFGRSERPLAWGTNPTRAVRLIFLIAVPEGDSIQYANLVRALTHLARSSALIRQLTSAPGAAEILELLREVPLGDPPLEGRGTLDRPGAQAGQPSHGHGS